jgi:uncharacterized protein (DUF58 family)
VSTSVLEPPAARQGPGPLAQPLIEALDLAITRLVARMLPGDRRAAGVGVGMELAQLRPYEIGDDVRHIDPAATARTGQPHVRLHVPERALTTWLVLDVSPSMAFGTARRLKADVQQHADALADALARVGRMAHQPGLVVAISDWRDQHAWQRPLASLRVRHSVLAVEIVDPREATLPAVGHLALVDPESGARIDVDTSNRRVRERFAKLERERREELARELRRLRIDHVTLATDQDWLLELGHHLR